MKRLKSFLETGIRLLKNFMPLSKGDDKNIPKEVGTYLD